MTSQPRLIAHLLPALSAAAFAAALSAGVAHAHGDVAPQPVDTAALPDVGEEWLTENPYRAEAVGEDIWRKAVDIGASGYIQNCARCHGLEVISGGLAPDLRYLEASEYDDEWYVERFRVGYTQGGITKMPAFDEVLGQKAGWAIRTYIETRPDDLAVAEVSDELKAMRDDLLDAEGDDEAAMVDRLMDIASQIETLSGAPIADSIALRAALVLQEDPTAHKQAAEILTVGLSAAQ
ncbi:cytochrome c-550 PedF [Meridianimarinicoccus aquatilis]|uniref:Cytochrome c-550 PedF n=1 Tax=Meridianimarinicoccus aquatilis TaxID=2552766 RepID=A0A4R6B104_9RHOB|nr:cytochrome c-550 PedF [Fluviibacterium aquatile]QIE43639.1 cytochrome c-550 PedF [Rhodobacteraceae bacterium SC52]TDL88153.1 cytochrome c-550 PedF [Fluviibacterium aquatile]